LFVNSKYYQNFAFLGQVTCKNIRKPGPGKLVNLAMVIPGGAKKISTHESEQRLKR
jgi:hypothetical protein